MVALLATLNITGYAKHYDSYYDGLGKEVVEAYFSNKDIYSVIEDDSNTYRDDNFITNGLFCEYGYVYNKDNDTLEIYRGFFKTPQWTRACGVGHDGTKYYTHLIFTVNRRIHTKEQIFKAFKAYDDSDGTGYPERKILFK